MKQIWNKPKNEKSIIDRPLEKSTDMDGKCFKEGSIFDQHCVLEQVDWKNHPVVNIYCPCPKHRIKC